MKIPSHKLILFAACICIPIQASIAAPSLANQTWPLRAADGLLHRPDLQAIVEIQCKRDADGLRSFFTNPDPLVRARAAFAAGSVQAPSILPDLFSLLNDPDERVRVDAAFALRQTPGASSKQLLQAFRKEKDKAVQAMLLGALGFQGDREAYDSIFAQDVPGQEIPYILCAIYSLQRDIVSKTGIGKMLKLLDHGQPEVREHAAYFFYVMKRQKAQQPELAEALPKRLKAYAYDDPAGPYLIRYIAAQGRRQDIGLLDAWRQNGESVRARSVAVEGLKYFTQTPQVRNKLIESGTDAHFHIADTAAEVLAGCEDLTGADLKSIQQHLAASRIPPTSRIHLWGLLWKRDEQKFIEAVIEKTPEADGIQLITAISAAPDLDDSLLTEKIDPLISHANPQVNTLTGSYLAQRLGAVDNPSSFALFDRFLNEVKDIKVRSEALFEAAFTLKDHQTPSQIAERYLGYYQNFLKANDLPSAASCLLILGSTQDAGALSVIRKALKHPQEIIRTTAEGAQKFHREGATKPINHCELDFAPVLKMNWGFLAKYGRHPRLVFTTRLGDIVVELDAEQAPMGAQNLIAHIEAGRFNGLHIYRLVPNHVIQAGPQGHFGYRILSEFTRIPKEEHTFGIGDYGKDTASQHIAITHLMRPHNEGKYTNLGLVVQGRDIVKNIDKYDLIMKTKVIPDPR